MLSLEQKRKIFNSFPELTEKKSIVKKSNTERFGYDFKESKRNKKEIARELTDTGNGYIYVNYLKEYKDQMDDRGFVNIKDFTETKLREIIIKVIQSFK